MILNINNIKKLYDIIHFDKINKVIHHPFFIDSSYIIIEINSEYTTIHKSKINPSNIDNILDFCSISHLNNKI